MALWPTTKPNKGGGSMPPSKLYVCGKLGNTSFSTLMSIKKCYRFGNIFCYNKFMEYITVVIDSFWLIMEQITAVFVPIICILLVFGIIKGLLFDAR